MPMIADELVSASQTITDEEVARSRAQIRAGLMMALESPAARAGQIARQILVHGRVLGPDEISSKIEAVTAEDMRRVAHETFVGTAPTLTAIGPVDGIMTLDDLTGRLEQGPVLRAASL